MWWSGAWGFCDRGCFRIPFATVCVPMSCHHTPAITSKRADPLMEEFLGSSCIRLFSVKSLDVWVSAILRCTSLSLHPHWTRCRGRMKSMMAGGYKLPGQKRSLLVQRSLDNEQKNNNQCHTTLICHCFHDVAVRSSTCRVKACRSLSAATREVVGWANLETLLWTCVEPFSCLWSTPQGRRVLGGFLCYSLASGPETHSPSTAEHPKNCK